MFTTNSQPSSTSSPQTRWVHCRAVQNICTPPTGRCTVSLTSDGRRTSGKSNTTATSVGTSVRLPLRP
eukprot:798648-Rhodomonas_salina.1